MNTNASVLKENQDEFAMSEAIHAYGRRAEVAPGNRGTEDVAEGEATWEGSDGRLGPLPESRTRWGAAKCPTCRSIIYSRRHALCGVCAQPLPANYLFSPSESERIEMLLTSERQRHRHWLKRVCS